MKIPEMLERKTGQQAENGEERKGQIGVDSEKIQGTRLSKTKLHHSTF